VADTEDQVLVVHQAEPGSRSAESLALLSTIAGAKGPGPLVGRRGLGPDHAPGSAARTTTDTPVSGHG